MACSLPWPAGSFRLERARAFCSCDWGGGGNILVVRGNRASSCQRFISSRFQPRVRFLSRDAILRVCHLIVSPSSSAGAPHAHPSGNPIQSARPGAGEGFVPAVSKQKTRSCRRMRKSPDALDTADAFALNA